MTASLGGFALPLSARTRPRISCSLAVPFFGAGVLHDAGRPGLSTLSTIAAVVMAVGSAGVILGLFTALRRLFGLAERLICLGFIGWFLALGIGQLTGV